MIDRFLADLVTKDHRLRLTLRSREIDQAVSLLLMLPTLRVKVLPKVLAIVEAFLRQHPTVATRNTVGAHVGEWYKELLQREAHNVYQLRWLGYFMTSNDLAKFLPQDKPKDPIARATRTNRFSALGSAPQHKHFRGSSLPPTLARCLSTTSLTARLEPAARSAVDGISDLDFLNSSPCTSVRLRCTSHALPLTYCT